jgi:hypothetical protein
MVFCLRQEESGWNSFFFGLVFALSRYLFYSKRSTHFPTRSILERVVYSLPFHGPKILAQLTHGLYFVSGELMCVMDRTRVM